MASYSIQDSVEAIILPPRDIIKQLTKSSDNSLNYMNATRTHPHSRLHNEAKMESENEILFTIHLMIMNE